MMCIGKYLSIPRTTRLVIPAKVSDWKQCLLISRTCKFLLFVLSALSTHAYAIEIPGGIKLHGFASQAFLYTTDNNFFGTSADDGSTGYTELGINASLLLGSRTRIAAQILSRRAGKGHNGDIQLDFGLIDQEFYSDQDLLFGIRAGRFKNPLGLYNDTRDVAFLRPGILLPQSIYFDRTRQLALSADGILFYNELRGQTGNLSLELGGGYPQIDTDVEIALFGADLPGHPDNDKSYIGRLIFKDNGDQFLLALSGALVNIDYLPGINDPLSQGRIRFEPWILSAQHNTERWSLTGEYALRRLEYEDFGALPDTEFYGESYYAQFTYRFNQDWEAMVRYDVLYSDRDDKSGKKFENQTGLPAYSRFAKDLTLGLRWDINPTFMVRVEWHHVNGTGWLTPQDNLDPFDTTQRWNLFGILGSFRF